MVHQRVIFLAFLFAFASVDAIAQKVAKEEIVSEGKKRTYYIYVPTSVKPSAAARKDLDKGFELDESLHAEFDPMIKQLRPNQ